VRVLNRERLKLRHKVYYIYCNHLKFMAKGKGMEERKIREEREGERKQERRKKKRGHRKGRKEYEGRESNIVTWKIILKKRILCSVIPE
jgi:hypothetical protein